MLLCHETTGGGNRDTTNTVVTWWKQYVWPVYSTWSQMELLTHSGHVLYRCVWKTVHLPPISDEDLLLGLFQGISHVWEIAIPINIPVNQPMIHLLNTHSITQTTQSINFPWSKVHPRTYYINAHTTLWECLVWVGRSLQSDASGGNHSAQRDAESHDSTTGPACSYCT